MININGIILKSKELYPDFIRDLEILTNIDRGSGCVSGLNQVIDFLRPRLEALGCMIEIKRDYEYGPILLARKTGTGVARILMLAHTDTVWPAGSCTNRPFRINENYAYGPGVADCANGVLAQYFALRILLEADFKNFGEIILLFNPDEEKGAPYSRQIIQDIAKDMDIALCMEGPDHPEEFISARGGTIKYTLEVYGKAEHAGTAPEKGSNAIVELIHKLIKVDALRSINGVIPNIGTIQGGKSTSIVADYARAEFGFRIDKLACIPQIEKSLEAIMMETIIEGTRSKLSFSLDNNHPPMEKLPGTEIFIELVKECGQEVGLQLKEKFCGGAADSGFTSQVGTITLDGLSPCGFLFHTEDEYLKLETIIPRLGLIALLLARISSDKKYWVRSAGLTN